MANQNTTVRIKTGVVRFSYAHVFEPHAIAEGAEPKYSVTLLLDKDAEDCKKTVAEINKALKDIYEAEKTGKFKGKKFDAIRKPLRDGDEEKGDDPTYQNCWFINTSCKTAPGVIDRAKKPLDEESFYSGCYGKASFTLCPYNNAGNIGVGAFLNNILKTADGEKLAGNVSAASDFANDLDDEDEDDSLL